MTEGPERCSVYTASTPLLVLLATGTASFQDKNRIKYLILPFDFRGADRFRDALERWKGNPFSRILLLEGQYGKVQVRFGAIRRAVASRKNIGALRAFFASEPTLAQGFDAFISAVEKPEGQFIGHVNRQRGGTNYHLGGMGAYLSDYLVESRWRTLLKKAIYGPWYSHAPSYPDYAYIDKLVIIRPDLVAKGALGKGAAGKEVVPLPQDLFVRLAGAGLAAEILKEWGIGRLPEWDVFIIAPLSEMNAQLGGVERLKALFGRLLDALGKSGRRTLFKYHPREELGDFLGAEGRPGVSMAPAAIPSEILCMCSRSGRGKTAVSDVSTALFLFKLMNPEAVAISIMGVLGYQYAETEEVFLSCGILIPKTMEELEALAVRQEKRPARAR